MTLLDAHASIFGRPDAIVVEAAQDGVDVSAAATVALAELSGGLGECETDEDLDAAVDLGWQLYQGGAVGAEDLDAVTRRVIVAVVEWGQQQ